MKFQTGRTFCPSFIVRKCTLILHNVFSEILFHFLLSNPACRAIILFVQVHMYQGAGDYRLRGDLFVPTCNLIWIMPTEGMYTMYLIEMPPHLLFFYMTYQEHTDDVFSDYGQQELHSGVGFLFFKRKENSTMKQNNTTKKLALAGVLTALAIVGSFISVPVAGSKCAPVQHMVNILAAVTLGPAWGVGIAFCASLLRNLLGLGSFMAFPGSMVGALCCGLVYKKCHILSLTCLAEAIGTGFLGALAAYPVALYLMGIAPAGLFVYVVPFLISTVAGSILAFILITVLEKGGVMSQIREA